MRQRFATSEQVSGNEPHGSWLWRSYLDQTDERFTEVIQCGFFGVALAMCTHTWTQLGVSAPHALLIALDDDRHGNGATLCHEVTTPRQSGSQVCAGQGLGDSHADPRAHSHDYSRATTAVNLLTVTVRLP